MPPYKMKRAVHQPYVRRLADTIGLRDWTINVSERKPDADAMADVHCTWGRRIATIRFSNDFMTETRANQRHYIVHELVHIFFAPMHNLLHHTINGVHHRAFNQAYEYGVDAVAEALAPLLPPPPIQRKARP